MNYDNYERDIVERHGIVLVCWLDNFLPVRNPSHVGGLEALQLLLGALVKETCHWVRLTDVQLEKRIQDNHARQSKGEAVYKPWRKPKVAAIKSWDTLAGDDDVDGADGTKNGDQVDSRGDTESDSSDA